MYVFPINTPKEFISLLLFIETFCTCNLNFASTLAFSIIS